MFWLSTIFNQSAESCTGVEDSLNPAVLTMIVLSGAKKLKLIQDGSFLELGYPNLNPKYDYPFLGIPKRYPPIFGNPHMALVGWSGPTAGEAFLV